MGVGGQKGTFSSLKLFWKPEDFKSFGIELYYGQYFQIIYLLIKEVASELFLKTYFYFSSLGMSINVYINFNLNFKNLSLN